MSCCPLGGQSDYRALATVQTSDARPCLRHISICRIPCNSVLLPRGILEVHWKQGPPQQPLKGQTGIKCCWKTLRISWDLKSSSEPTLWGPLRCWHELRNNTLDTINAPFTTRHTCMLGDFRTHALAVSVTLIMAHNLAKPLLCGPACCSPLKGAPGLPPVTPPMWTCSSVSAATARARRLRSTSNAYASA